MQREIRRVAVTGLGLVTPLGPTVESTWRRLLAGDCAISRVPELEALPCQIAGRVRRGTGPGEFDAKPFLSNARTQDVEFISFALAAAQEALDDAGWHPTEEEDMNMTGVAVGSGIGSLEEIQAAAALLAQPRGHRRISPFFVTRLLINMAAGHISMTHNLRGPNVRSRAVVAALHPFPTARWSLPTYTHPIRLTTAPTQSHNAVSLAAHVHFHTHPWNAAQCIYPIQCVDRRCQKSTHTAATHYVSPDTLTHASLCRHIYPLVPVSLFTGSPVRYPFPLDCVPPVIPPPPPLHSRLQHSCVTACATGAHSIGDASRLIAFGDADVMVAGGTEAAITPLAIAGFSRAKALCTSHNDDPEGCKVYSLCYTNTLC